MEYPESCRWGSGMIGSGRMSKAIPREISREECGCSRVYRDARKLPPLSQLHSLAATSSVAIRVAPLAGYLCRHHRRPHQAGCRLKGRLWAFSVVIYCAPPSVGIAPSSTEQPSCRVLSAAPSTCARIRPSSGTYLANVAATAAHLSKSAALPPARKSQAWFHALTTSHSTSSRGNDTSTCPGS